MYTKNLKYGLILIVILFSFSGCFENKNGFDENGIHKETKTMYSPNGYNKEGYDKNGFDSIGFHKETKTTYSPNGYNVLGYDEKGFNSIGIHKETKTTYNLDGYNKEGYDENGIRKDCIFVDNKNICIKETRSNSKLIISAYKKLSIVDKEIDEFKKLKKFNIKDEFESTLEYSQRMSKILESEYIKNKNIEKEKLLSEIDNLKLISIDFNNEYEYKNVCDVDTKESYPKFYSTLKYDADSQSFIVNATGNKMFNYNITSDTMTNGYLSPILYFNGYIISSEINSKKNNFNFSMSPDKAKLLKDKLKFIAFLEVTNINIKEKIYLECESSKLKYNRISRSGEYSDHKSFDRIDLYELKSKIKYIVIATENDKIIHIERF